MRLRTSQRKDRKKRRHRDGSNEKSMHHGLLSSDTRRASSVPPALIRAILRRKSPGLSHLEICAGVSRASRERGKVSSPGDLRETGTGAGGCSPTPAPHEARVGRDAVELGVPVEGRQADVGLHLPPERLHKEPGGRGAELDARLAVSTVLVVNRALVG